MWLRGWRGKNELIRMANSRFVYRRVCMSNVYAVIPVRPVRRFGSYMYSQCYGAIETTKKKGEFCNPPTSTPILSPIAAIVYIYAEMDLVHSYPSYL